MWKLLLCLVLVGCSRGGAECLDTPDCPLSMACDVEAQRCVKGAEARDAMSVTPDLAVVPVPRDLMRCPTEPPWLMCSGVCTNTLVGDNLNCGACGRTCGPSDMGAPTNCCNASCADTKRDINHCGRCYNVCGASAPWCCNGMCSSMPCR